MADCMQFLLKNHLMSNFWIVWFLKTESEPNFGFPHIPSHKSSNLSLWTLYLDKYLYQTLNKMK